MPNDVYRSYVTKILADNRTKNFVQRILNPSMFPSLPNPDGTMSTHKMSWADDGAGNAIVYPTIVYDNYTKKLSRLEPRAAIDRAISTGEFIYFPSSRYGGKAKNEAEWFSTNYKRYWDK
jgi:hypothetical protein